MGMIQEREIDVAGKGRIAGDTVLSNDKCYSNQCRSL